MDRLFAYFIVYCWEEL